MTLTDHPGISRAAALVVLAVLVTVVCLGPLAAYCGLIADNNDALATKAALLQRYRGLGETGVNTPAPTVQTLLYPDMPESRASALLQETVKNAATATHVQVQGLQVLHRETQSGAVRIGVRVRASGDVASLRSFLYAIETGTPVLYPDNLSIQSHATAADAAPSPLDFQLDISGFKAEPRS